jgi:hypothetical protein
MGVLSVLGKLGKAALNIGTGGISGAILDNIGSAGNVMGAQQGGQNNARLAQGQLNLGHDRNLLDRYGLEQRAQMDAGQMDLQRKGFETGNRSASAKQALIGALLGGGMAPTNIAGGQRSGGIFAALQSNPEALAAMKTLGSQGSAAQSAPLQFTGGQMVAPPTLSEMPKLDAADGKMGTLAKVLQVIGSLGGGGGGGDDDGRPKWGGAPTGGGDWGGYG